MTRLASFALLIATAAALGCGNDTVLNPVQGGFDGTYLLQSANGASLPAWLYSWQATATDTGSVYSVADTLEITADGNYRDNAWFEARSGNTLLGRVHRFDRGLVTRTGDLLRFDSNFIDNVSFDGTLSSDRRLATTRTILPETGSVDYVLRRR